MVLALYGIACLYLYVLRVLVTLGGCQGDECMARKVGELVLYACQMEEAVLQIKRLLDDVRAGLAWQLLAATVDEVERSDLAREVSAMVHALKQAFAA